MPLILPPYIQRSNVVDDPEFAYARLDERLQHRMDGTTDRGVLALAAGFAEWVAWRFSKLSGDVLLFNKCEAIWAANVDWRYLSSQPLPPVVDWRGPVRGPLWSAANWLD